MIPATGICWASQRVVLKLLARRSVSFHAIVASKQECLEKRMPGMNPINLIVTVCAVLSPATCEETHLTFNWSGSLQQCTMGAQPYIAQWVGEHPKWTAVRWRCEYPHTNDKAAAGTPARG
jgi:hypothetical protein